MPDEARVATHVLSVRVYYEDTDSGGIVYYANYLKYAERARTEMLRLAGVESSSLMADDGVALAVKECHVEYHRPARLDDMLEIRTRIEAVGGASIALGQDVHRGDELLVSMKIKLACMSVDTGAPRRLPDRLRERIA